MELVSLSDNEVAKRLQAARGKAFEEVFREIVRRYKNGIMTFLTRYTGDPRTAEDLAQETFVRVYRKIERYNPDAKFSTWIFTIAGNLAKDEFKRRRRHPAVSYDWQSSGRAETTKQVPVMADETEEPSRLAVQTESGRQVQEALSNLDGQDREVLVLRDIQGMRYEDIAEMLSLPLGTVKSRISRARAAFKALWEKMHP